MEAARPGTGWILVAAAGGAIVGAAIAAGDRLGGWPDEALDFAEKPQFLTWFAVVCLEVAGWAVAALLVCSALRSLRAYWRRRIWSIVGRGAMLLLLLAAGVFVSRKVGVSYRHTPLPGLKGKTAALTALGATVALLAAAGMWLVHSAVEAEVCDTEKPNAADLEKYVERGAQMRLLLGIQGAILGGAILGAGALRNALIANHTVTKGGLPEEYVVMYGAFLSALVALCYLPTQAAILSLGARLRDRCLGGGHSPGTDAWDTWYARRKSLDEMLGLSVGPSASLKAGAAILTPLTVGVIGVLLPASH